MMDRIVRVGVVGASADAGWARAAHIPAIAALPGARLTAVATTRVESAEKAAGAFGAAHAFTSAASLAACPDVDVVLVSVKAPQHREATMAAIEAGKAVCVEWPMGANLAEAEALAEAARSAGVPSFVVLQARVAPPVIHALDLIRNGYLGRPFSATMQGSFSYWGDPVTTGYSANVRNGASVLTIPGGHGLDLMTCLMGPVANLAARDTHLRQSAMATDLGRSVSMTSPDQFACIGELASGALFSAHFVGAAPHGEHFSLYLIGDEGELLLEGRGMPEVVPLALSGTNDRAKPLSPIAIPPPARAFDGKAPGGAALNVAQLWGDMIDDLTNGTRTAPDFDHGVQSRRLVDAIARSAASSADRVPTQETANGNEPVGASVR